MENPCYDTKTKTDCPYRSVGCASTCKRWAEYTERRAQFYEDRKKQCQASNDMCAHHMGLCHKLRYK